jgi:signal transduction histidine kinase
LELAVTCKDGRELPVEISLSPARVAGKRIVIASIRDITERKRIEEELHGLSARLINAQEEERKRIARELHDDFNQRLALVTIDIEQLSRERAGSPEGFDGHIRSLLGRIEELSLDVHRLSHRLHPAALDHLGLMTAVKSLCQEMSALHDFRIHFTGRKIPDVVPNDVALCCYRIAQEALRNVIKHSGAREAHVELARTKQGLELRVRDQGAGFDMAETESRGGLGLISMRERLRLVGGQITIKSSAAHGTEVDVLVPLSAADAV